MRWEENIKINLREMDFEDGNQKRPDLGSCQVVHFSITSIHVSESTIRELVT
jgi:hypothetical protein